MASEAGAWTRPGVYDVGSGIYRVPLPMPTNGLRAVSAYAIRSGRELVMVDSGWALPEAMDRFDEALEVLGSRHADVRQFVVTHAHGDHYSLAVDIRRRHGTPIAIGAAEEESIRAVIADWDSGYVEQAERLILAGASELAGELLDWIRLQPHHSRIGDERYELPDRWLADGDVIPVGERMLRVVATPGHTRGHLVYVDEEAGVLFSGDHILPHITPSVGFEPVRAALALGDYLASLRAMLALPDFSVLPAHGPVGFSLHERARQLLRYHDDRLSDIAAVVAGGRRYPLDIARAIGWTRRGTHFDDLDVLNRALALNETVAHLELLVHEGRLPVSVERGMAAYG